MPPHKRSKVEPTDDWEQLKLLVDTPEQLSYELIRPVVFFGRSPAQRAKETGTAQRTIHRGAAQFADTGMRSLFAPLSEPHRRLAPEIRRAILELKAEHPALKNYEITTICGVPPGPRFAHRPSPHTVERILAENALPLPARRRYPPYQQIPDPRFFTTRFRSAQPPRWELDPEEWLPIRRLPEYARRSGRAKVIQGRLFPAPIDGGLLADLAR